MVRLRTALRMWRSSGDHLSLPGGEELSKPRGKEAAEPAERCQNLLQLWVHLPRPRDPLLPIRACAGNVCSWIPQPTGQNNRHLLDSLKPYLKLEGLQPGEPVRNPRAQVLRQSRGPRKKFAAVVCSV